MGKAIIDTPENNLVIVHDGRRGARGTQGKPGPKGEQGRGIEVKGSWVSGTSYGPGDAVTDRSRMIAGVTSLYLQRTDKPLSASTLPPWQDTARWVEVGASDFSNSFGGIWEVYQLDHGFTKIGQPVAFSTLAARYVLASAGNEDELGIAVVREVIDDDRVILQSTGEVPNIDPSLIYPSGDPWQLGATYYVSMTRGRLEPRKPTDPNAFANPILIAADDDPQTGGVNGIALPWAPVTGVREYIPVGKRKFYYTAAAGQTRFDGPDENNNLLQYLVGSNTEVFVNGLNLRETSYVATDGTRIDIPGANTGDLIEIWTPDRPLDILVRSTVLKLDNIEAQFDGSETTFALTYGGAPVVFQDAASVQVWLDATSQEPLVDYELQDTAGDLQIVFRDPPEPSTRFWGVALSPSGQAGVPPGGAAGAALTKLSSADGDMAWATGISGGAW